MGQVGVVLSCKTLWCQSKVQYLLPHAGNFFDCETIKYKSCRSCSNYIQSVGFSKVFVMPLFFTTGHVYAIKYIASKTTRTTLL